MASKPPAYESLFVVHAMIAVLWFVDIPFFAPYWLPMQIILHAILPAWTYVVARRGSRWLGLLLGHGGLILAYSGFLIWFAVQHWTYPYLLPLIAMAAGVIAAYTVYCMVVVAILRRVLPPPHS